jgi:N-acetylmuramic acid 6-phosphate etherase
MDPSSDLPPTEQDNPRSHDLSSRSVIDIVSLINEEDALVAKAVQHELPRVSAAVEAIVARLANGGRLFYVGTGTSGRLGVLDASECPPTFGVPGELVQAVIAGGYEACYRAVEASEDDRAAGGRDLDARGVTGRDAVVGIAASGRTPYTLGALEHARALGAFTAAVTCVPGSAITRMVDVAIVPLVGPEVVTGSTRMKAGTAQKLVLNTISTVSMIGLGKTYGNLMVDVVATNEKLRARVRRVVRQATGAGEAEVDAALAAAGGDAKVAIVSLLAGIGADEARHRLEAAGGRVRAAVDGR